MKLPQERMQDARNAVIGRLSRLVVGRGEFALATMFPEYEQGNAGLTPDS